MPAPKTFPTSPRRHRVAADRLGTGEHGADHSTSPLAPGSPVRYYAAAAPATLPALLAAVAAGWNQRSSRRWLGLAAACSITGVGVTAYLVRAVNVRLFFSTQTLTVEERQDLLRIWYRSNNVRLVLLVGTLLAAHQARSRLRQRSA